MMKLLLLVSVFVVFATAAPPQELDYLYGIDFDAILANDTDRQATFDCILDKASCGDKQYFKDSVIKVALNKCKDCNAEQKQKYDYVLKKIHDDYESFYNEFTKLMETRTT